MVEISVIGSLNMDLVVKTSRLPEGGETIFGEAFNLIPGGKGANQAVASSRAGVKTKMFGCLGSDPFSKVLLESLTDSGVDVDGLEILDGESTGVASIILDQYAENRIIVIPGANHRVDPEYVDRHWEEIRKSALIIMQHEIPIETITYIINKAELEDIPVLLNPAPYHPISDEVMGKIDYLIPNEIEAKLLSGIEVIDEESVRSTSELFTSKGVGHVIITLGSEGAVCFANDEFIEQPAFSVTAVDTTAAGDTFVGYFGASIVSGKSLKEALEIAAAASALTVTKLGAQSSIPDISATKRFLKEKEIRS